MAHSILFTLYVGLDSSKGRQSPRAVLNKVAEAFPAGFTVTGATGGWFDVQTQTSILEDSLRVELVLADSVVNRTKVRMLANRIANEHYQQAVLVTETPLASVEFVDPS